MSPKAILLAWMKMLSDRHRNTTACPLAAEVHRKRECVVGAAGLRSRRRGFTLIEILVVVVIIAILATLVAPNIFQHVGTARETTARSQVEMFGAALDAYRLHTGRYPSTQEGLGALWTRPASAPSTWRGPYLRKQVPLDPWGKAYLYMSPGEVNRDGYDLLSLGADGRRGGGGENADVTSW